MRQPFAMEAVVDLAPGADAAAIGGAVTLALCGAFAHPGPCPLAPHHTSVEPFDGAIRARVVAACAADQRETVVGIVTAALESGAVLDPDGIEQRWSVRSCRVVRLLEPERELADRLASAL